MTLGWDTCQNMFIRATGYRERAEYVWRLVQTRIKMCFYVTFGLEVDKNGPKHCCKPTFAKLTKMQIFVFVSQLFNLYRVRIYTKNFPLNSNKTIRFWIVGQLKINLCNRHVGEISGSNVSVSENLHLLACDVFGLQLTVYSSLVNRIIIVQPVI